jgi:lysine-specific histone demethylase 1
MTLILTDWITDSSPNQDESDLCYKASAVLCTIPVGCLKESKTKELKVDEDEQLSVPAVRFDPPLPAKKREAIEEIRVGSTNKVILVFERRFWSDNCFFGRINDKEYVYSTIACILKFKLLNFRCARGELFLFASNPNSKVLSVYMAGAAANLGDNFSNDDLSNKLMQILGKIHGADCPSGVIF